MTRRGPEPTRPSLTRGGGAGLLRWGSIVVYAIVWAWLLLGLMKYGRVIESSVCLALLILLVLAEPSRRSSRLETVGGLAAIGAGLIWAAGATLVVRFDMDDAGWTTAASALFLLPAVLAMREREKTAEWLGSLGFIAGFLPMFLGAALTGGILGPISGSSAIVWSVVGLLLLVAGSLPFGVVAIWSRRLSLPGALLVLCGAATYVVIAAANPGVSAVGLVTAFAGLTYGAGWAWLGLDTLLRPCLGEHDPESLRPGG
jgi:hypothetical protein